MFISVHEELSPARLLLTSENGLNDDDDNGYTLHLCQASGRKHFNNNKTRVTERDLLLLFVLDETPTTHSEIDMSLSFNREREKTVVASPAANFLLMYNAEIWYTMMIIIMCNKDELSSFIYGRRCQMNMRWQTDNNNTRRT